MLIFGLTGSIGMGKSTAARLLRQARIAVFDADAVVHQLMEPGGAAVAKIAAAFPEAWINGFIDRQTLGNCVYLNNAELLRLEAILHPLVWQAQDRFLAAASRRRAALVVLDIPLLFETQSKNLYNLYDYIIVVTAPRFLQELRVLARPGMSPQRFAQILHKQMPDAEKRRRADFVVATGLGRRPALRQLKTNIKWALLNPPRHVVWSPGARNRSRYRNHRT